MSPYDLRQAVDEERLRQAREAFDQRRDHHERWIAHRMALERALLITLTIGSAIVTVLIVCATVVLASAGRLDAKAIVVLTSALASTLGLLGSAWRFLPTRPPADLEPVARLAEGASAAAGEGERTGVSQPASTLSPRRRLAISRHRQRREDGEDAE